MGGFSFCEKRFVQSVWFDGHAVWLPVAGIQCIARSRKSQVCL
jgi:hypothetical protein